MTTYYVGPGGNDANSGLSWANRKLTLNGAEDVPVVAWDTVYVGPGTYRETLTADVSGTAGNPIEYRADYLGQNTDGVGGLVRITGSDNDQLATRTNCIDNASRDNRTYTGFLLDTTIDNILSAGDQNNLLVDKCIFQNIPAGVAGIYGGFTGTNNTIQNCAFIVPVFTAIQFTNGITTNNRGHIVQNCIFLGGGRGITISRVGGITIKNNIFLGGLISGAIRVDAALAVGQTAIANNNIFHGCGVALQATAVGEISENYNSFFGNSTDRINTDVGANSLAYPPFLDPRWFFQLTNAGVGPYNLLQIASLFDLTSFSQLLNVAGSNPPSADLRGTAVQGAQREWGALEYDSTLKIFGGIKKSRIQIGQ